MKNVLIALVCTAGAVACGGETRPAENPSTTSTSVTTETTTASNPDRHATDISTSAPTTGTGMGNTGTVGATAKANAAPQPAPVTTPAPAPAPADTSATTGTTPAANNPGSADNTKNATNTGINDRDRHGALTPMDQGGGKDRDITAAIRRAVVGDGSLSFNAKNVKIITVAGKVTLRGPVKSDAEKASIESKAKAAQGVTEVDNQLEVKK